MSCWFHCVMHTEACCVYFRRRTMGNFVVYPSPLHPFPTKCLDWYALLAMCPHFCPHIESEQCVLYVELLVCAIPCEYLCSCSSKWILSTSYRLSNLIWCCKYHLKKILFGSCFLLLNSTVIYEMCSSSAIKPFPYKIVFNFSCLCTTLHNL